MSSFPATQLRQLLRDSFRSFLLLYRVGSVARIGVILLLCLLPLLIELIEDLLTCCFGLAVVFAGDIGVADCFSHLSGVELRDIEVALLMAQQFGGFSWRFYPRGSGVEFGVYSDVQGGFAAFELHSEAGVGYGGGFSCGAAGPGLEVGPS